MNKNNNEINQKMQNNMENMNINFKGNNNMNEFINNPNNGPSINETFNDFSIFSSENIKQSNIQYKGFNNNKHSYKNNQGNSHNINKGQNKNIINNQNSIINNNIQNNNNIFQNNNQNNIFQDNQIQNFSNFQNSEINGNDNQNNMDQINQIINNNLQINNQNIINDNNFNDNNFNNNNNFQNNINNSNLNNIPNSLLNNNHQSNIISQNYQNNINNNNFENNNIHQQNLNNPQIQNDSNNKIPKPIEQNKYSFSRYTKAPQTGLKNMGDTSYLNAVLQLIGNIRNFASFFVNPKNAKYINENMSDMRLSFIFHRLFTHLYPYPEKQHREKYEPKYLKKMLSEMNIVYNTNKRRNPNELISFILNSLHNELNQLKNNNQILKPNNIYDRNNVIYCGNMNFINNNNSIISNLLNWFEIKKINCIKCNQNIYEFYSYNTFELDILGAYNYKKNIITLYDCLKYYSIPKKQNLYCRSCGVYTQMIISPKIYCCPNSFIFSLDRKNLDNNLLQIPFLINDAIDMTNFVENEISPKQYQLSGIVSYYKGWQKYISFCKSPVDKQWYLYNDEDVQVQHLNVLDLHNNSNNQFIPCLLFYSSIK